MLQGNIPPFVFRDEGKVNVIYWKTRRHKRQCRHSSTHF